MLFYYYFIIKNLFFSLYILKYIRIYRVKIFDHNKVNFIFHIQLYLYDF